MNRGLPPRVTALFEELQPREEEIRTVRQQLQNQLLNNTQKEALQRTLQRLTSSQRYQLLRDIRDRQRLPGLHTFARNLLNNILKERETVGPPFRGQIYVIAGAVPDILNAGFDFQIDREVNDNLGILVSLIIQLGGRVNKNVTRDTTAVVLGANPKQKKINLAERFGIEQIDILDFLRICHTEQQQQQQQQQ